MVKQFQSQLFHTCERFRVFFESNTPQALLGSDVALSKSDSHHLKSVLRIPLGATITAIDRKSAKKFRAQVKDYDGVAHLTLTQELVESQHPFPLVTVVVSLLKGSKNDYVCEKCTELGVKNILFWHSERSVVRLDGLKDVENKLSRFNRVTEAAAKQCGQASLPYISILLSLEELIASVTKLRTEDSNLLLCSLSPKAKQLSEIDIKSPNIITAIGPEGDFAQTEEEALLNYGFTPVNLGAYTLRAETAAIVSVAMFSAILVGQHH